MPKEFEVRVKIWKEGKTIIIEAMDFPLVTQGDTIPEALDNFKDAFNLAMQDQELRHKIEEAQLKVARQISQKAPIIELRFPYLPLELTQSYAQNTAFVWQRTT